MFPGKRNQGSLQLGPRRVDSPRTRVTGPQRIEAPRTRVAVFLTRRIMRKELVCTDPHTLRKLVMYTVPYKITQPEGIEYSLEVACS